MSNVDLEQHISKYMIHVDNLKDYIDFFNVESIFCFDTESCFENERIKSFYENKKGDKPKDKNHVKVYAWGLSNTNNDYVLYGETLDQFFKAVNIILYSRTNLMGKMSKKKLMILEDV